MELGYADNFGDNSNDAGLIDHSRHRKNLGVVERFYDQQQSLNRLINARDDQVVKQQVKIIESFDKQFFNWIVRWHNALTGDKLDIAEIRDLVDFILELNKEQTYYYLDALRFPEVAINAKIPRLIPNPTASFRFKHSITLTPNANGCFWFAFNPTFLGTPSGTGSTFITQTAAALDGVTPVTTATYVGADISQNIPALYSNYVLVSGSIIVRMDESITNSKGRQGGGITRDKNLIVNIGPTQTVNASVSRYTKFDLVDQLKYSMLTQAVDGLRMLYFPPDDNFLAFKDVTDPLGTIPAFGWIVYGQGLPSTPNCVRIDVFLNFEAEPDPVYSSLIPTTLPPETPDQVNPSIKAVKDKPMMRAKDYEAMQIGPMDKSRKNAGFLDTIKDFSGAFLPSLTDMAALAAKQLLPKGISDMLTGLNVPAKAFNDFMGTDTAKNLNSAFKKVSVFK